MKKVDHTMYPSFISLPWIKETEFTKNLALPRHMGGLNRMESQYIREYMKKEVDRNNKQKSKFGVEKYFREQ